MNENSQAEINLATQSLEMQEKIFMWLHAKDIAQLSMVSKQFQLFKDYEPLWKAKLLEKFPTSLKYFGAVNQSLSIYQSCDIISTHIDKDNVQGLAALIKEMPNAMNILFLLLQDEVYANKFCKIPALENKRKSFFSCWKIPNFDGAGELKFISVVNRLEIFFNIYIFEKNEKKSSIEFAKNFCKNAAFKTILQNDIKNLCAFDNNYAFGLMGWIPSWHPQSDLFIDLIVDNILLIPKLFKDIFLKFEDIDKIFQITGNRETGKIKQIILEMLLTNDDLFKHYISNQIILDKSCRYLEGGAEQLIEKYHNLNSNQTEDANEASTSQFNIKK